MAKEKITDEELITRISRGDNILLGYMGDTISQQRETSYAVLLWFSIWK